MVMNFNPKLSRNLTEGFLLYIDVRYDKKLTVWQNKFSYSMILAISQKNKNISH